MAETTKIEWCDHTFNHVRGCTKVSEGCQNCYAEKGSKRNPKVLGVWGPNGSRVVAAESYWKEPLKWDREAAAAGERRRVFCASLADVFEDWQGPIRDTRGLIGHVFLNDGSIGFGPDMHEYHKGSNTRMLTLDDVRLRLFQLIARTPNLDWLLLTKRPERMAEFVREATDALDGICRRGDFRADFANVWLGVSVENRAALARIDILRQTPAAIRFLSVEPLLEDLGTIDLAGISWVICGGESGHKARPCRVEWIRSAVKQCKDAGVACFVKQLGANIVCRNDCFGGWEPDQWPDDLDPMDVEHDIHGFREEHQGADCRVKLRDPKGGNPSEWPEDLRVREMPATSSQPDLPLR